MADKKKKSPESDFDDDFPEINDDASVDDVSLDDFPDNIDFPSDDPEEASGEVDTDAALDDFGDLEDVAEQPQEAGDDFEEVAEAADDDWGGVEGEEEAGEEVEEDIDDESIYDSEADEAEPTLVSKLKKQAPFLGAAIFCAGFVAYVGMGILSGGGSAPQQQQNAQNYNLAPTPLNGPPTGPSPNGADVEPPPGVPTGPSGQPPPPAAGSEGHQEAPPPQELPFQAQQDVKDANLGGFPPMPTGQPDSVETPLPGMQQPGASDIGGAPRMVDGEVLDQLVTKNDLSSVLAETMEEVVGHRFNEVMTSINTLSVDIDDLASSVNDISTKVQDLNFEVADIRANVTNVETRMDDYEDRLESLEFRLENLSINDKVASQPLPPSISAAEPPLVPPAPVAEPIPSEEAAGFDASAPLMQQEPDSAPAPLLPTEETTLADAEEADSEEQAQAESAEETVVAEEVSAPAPPTPAAKPEPKKQAKVSPQRRAPAATPSRPVQGGMLNPPEKPLVVQGYYLKGVSRGLAWIDTGRGIIRAGVGQHIDGLGRIQRISQGPDGWMVMTDTGLILP